MGAACSSGSENSSPPVSSVDVGVLHDRRKHGARSVDRVVLDADRASTLSLDEEITDSHTNQQNQTFDNANYKQGYNEASPLDLASIDDVRVSVSQALGVDTLKSVSASRNDRAMIAKHDSQMRNNIQQTLGATIHEEQISMKDVGNATSPVVPSENMELPPPASPTAPPPRPESAPCLSQPPSIRFTPPSNATPIPSSSSSASSSSIRSLSQASLMHQQESLIYQMQLLQQQQQMQQQVQPMQHVSFPQHLLSFGVQQRFARELELSMEELLSHPPNALSLLELPSARPTIPPARVAVHPAPSWSPFSTPRYSVADYAEDGTPIIEPAPPRRKLNSLMQTLVIEVLSNMTDEQREDLACTRKKYLSHRAPKYASSSPVASPKSISFRNRPATGAPLTPLCSPKQFPVGHTIDTPFPPQPVGEGLDVLEYRLALLAAKIEWRELRRAPVPISLFNHHANLTSAELMLIASRQTTEPPVEGGVLHFMRDMNQSQHSTPPSVTQPAPAYLSFQSWSPVPLHPLSFSPINHGFIYPTSATTTASSQGSPSNSYYSLSHTSLPVPALGLDSCVNSMSSSMQVMHFTGSPPYQANTTAACYAHPLSLQNPTCSLNYQYPQPMMTHPLEANPPPVHPLASHSASAYSMHSQGPSASPSSFQNTIQAMDCSHPLYTSHSHSHSQSFSLGHSQSQSLHHGHSLSFDLHQPAHPLDTGGLHMQPTTTY